jgi:tetratricopeptide (TPR) repeat protein
VVQSLVDKSLVRTVGEARFDLLRSVQDYAAQALADDVCAATASAHARHFHRWMAGLRRAAESSDREALLQLDVEFENCALAWRWAVAHRELDALAGSAWTLLNFCDHRGRFEEGLALMRLAIAAAGPPAPAGFEPLLLGASAHLEYRLDRYDDAEATARRALAAARTGPDPATRLLCFKVVGACCIALERHADAEHYLARALRLARALTDARNVAAMLDNLALVRKAVGRYEDSLRLAMQALGQYRQLGDAAGEALCLNNIAALQMDLGDYDAAAVHFGAGLALSERHELVGTRGLILANLTELALKTDDTGSAQAHAQDALAIARHIGSRTIESWLDLQLARIALRGADLAAARSHLRTSLDVATAIGRPSLQLAGVALCAEILAAQGEVDGARAVLAYAADHPSMTPQGRDDLRPVLKRWEVAAGSAATWPGVDLGDLVRRIVVEAEVAYRPLIGLLSAPRR